MIKINYKDWNLQVDLNGGRIIELSKNKRKILGSYQRIDGKIGNTHLCVPNFGAEGKELGLPFHGPARNSTWQVRFSGDNSISIEATLGKTLLYPTQLRVRQKFVLGINFNQQIEIKNIGKLPVPVNPGIHYYWDTPAGWQDTSINGKKVTGKIKNNGSIKLTEKNAIKFPQETEIILKQSGFFNAVLWTGFREEGGKKTYDQNYCCIEPVAGVGYFGRKKGFLPAGKSLIFRVQVNA